jgi:hypothetical protein
MIFIINTDDAVTGMKNTGDQPGQIKNPAVMRGFYVASNFSSFFWSLTLGTEAILLFHRAVI